MRDYLMLQIVMIGLLAMTLCVTPALAQWSHDSYVNTAVCTAANNKSDLTTVSDGFGGAISTWQDSRGSDADIYAQRVNASGAPQWTANGVAICTATGDQASPTIVSDGSGGAIITWQDYRNGSDYDIYSQRVNASGAPQWTANGVAVCTATGNQSNPIIVSDGSGGAIITWQDYRNGSDYNIYSQRVNASGASQWTANGVAICTATGDQASPTVASDGSGGAIITWQDYRNGSDWDIYVQQVNASGAAQWTVNGVAVCTATGYQQYPIIVSDGSGGGIITWMDYRSGPSHLYAQRVSASGNPQWTTDGVAICSATGGQDNPTIVSDGLDGAIITWFDYRNGNADIYAQLVNASGASQWTANGVAICTAVSDQQEPTIISDGSGGAIITWQDYRNGAADIYAQGINSSGAVQWTPNGVAISTATSDQIWPTILSDGSGGAIITWEDFRSGNGDIYAQKVDRYGYLGDIRPLIQGVKDVTNDQGGKVTVTWSPSYLDAYPNTTITSYYIFRGVSQTIGMKNVKSWGDFLKEIVIGRIPKNALMTTPRSVQGTDAYYWEYIDSVRALQLPGYSYTMPTVSDSGPQGTAMCYAMVMARTSNALTYWLSMTDSGYSVDNLPPLPVASLSLQPEAGPSVNVHWSKDITDPERRLL